MHIQMDSKSVHYAFDKKICWVDGRAKIFNNIGTASTLSSIFSRVHDHDRHGGIKFTFTAISVDQVVDGFKAISNSKASDLDGIGIKLIRYWSNIVISNMCLKQGSIPDKLKVARVTPIYKSGKKDEFSNYRPISVLPKYVRNLLKRLYTVYKYVTDNNLMYVG